MIRCDQYFSNLWKGIYAGCTSQPATTWMLITVSISLPINIFVYIYIHIYINMLIYIHIWSSYSDLTRPHPKWWFSKRNPLISGKSMLVKYHPLARYIIYLTSQILFVCSKVVCMPAIVCAALAGQLDCIPCLGRFLIPAFVVVSSPYSYGLVWKTSSSNASSCLANMMFSCS